MTRSRSHVFATQPPHPAGASPARIAVLISGRGSNLRALLDAMRDGALGGTVTSVISSSPDAAGLAVARERGVPATVVDHRRFATRDAFDTALAGAIDAANPDLIVLAGFMRVLGAPLVRRYEGRMINVHPSLLPAYAGLHTHRRALHDGARSHGCTVHFVTPDVDGGPIIAQAALPVHADDDEFTLAARVLALEHLLLPAAVRWYCTGQLVSENGAVRVRGLEGVAAAPAPSSRS